MAAPPSSNSAGTGDLSAKSKSSIRADRRPAGGRRRRGGHPGRRHDRRRRQHQWHDRRHGLHRRAGRRRQDREDRHARPAGAARGTLHVAVNRVSGVTVGLGGYVASSKTSYGGSVPTAEITVRVPAASFDSAIAQFRAMHDVTVLADSESGADVTGQYTDLQAQLQAATGERDALLGVLARAQSIGDILAVHDRVVAAQTVVDQLQNQINQLGNQASFSSIALTVSEKPVAAKNTAAHPPKPETGLAEVVDRRQARVHERDRVADRPVGRRADHRALRPRAALRGPLPLPHRAPRSRVAARALRPVRAREHLLEQAAEHDEVVGIGRLLHRAVGDAALARADRHDREPQRGVDLEPVEVAARCARSAPRTRR